MAPFLRDYSWKNLSYCSEHRLGQYRVIAPFGFWEESWDHLAIDFLRKELWPFSLPTFFGIQGISPVIVCTLSCLGHTFPILLRFKGGKAVATVLVCLGFSLSCYSFWLFIFLASTCLTSMISFQCYRCATRHSFGPPSSFNWMDLAQL